MGQQYDYLTKQPLYFTDGVTPFNYVNEIASIDDAREFDGYRFGKYEIKIGQKWETDQDWVVFRLGETLMMKAECLLRSGDAQGAADIVNEVRRRSFDPSLPQSVRELTAEQLIRWDLYVNGSWTFHTPKQKKYLELYPIPSSELLSNINLRQNDGYSY